MGHVYFVLADEGPRTSLVNHLPPGAKNHRVYACRTLAASGQKQVFTTLISLLTFSAFHVKFYVAAGHNLGAALPTLLLGCRRQLHLIP
jgi:hypothetical protein